MKTNLLWNKNTSTERVSPQISGLLLTFDRVQCQSSPILLWSPGNGIVLWKKSVIMYSYCAHGFSIIVPSWTVKMFSFWKRIPQISWPCHCIYIFLSEMSWIWPLRLIDFTFRCFFIQISDKIRIKEWLSQVHKQAVCFKIFKTSRDMQL